MDTVHASNVIAYGRTICWGDRREMRAIGAQEGWCGMRNNAPLTAQKESRPSEP
jgi:hypothetical protein